MPVSEGVFMRTFTVNPQSLLLSLALLSVVAGVTPVAAQNNNPNRALQEKLQRVQQRSQALEQEKSALQAEKAQSESALKNAQRDVGRLQASARLAVSLKGELAQQATENEGLKARLAAAESKMADLQAELKREQTSFRNSAVALQETRQQLDVQTKNFSACKSGNQALFELNTDLLSKYEAAYKAGSMLRGGFVTQLDWVKVENDNADIRDRLTAARIR